MKINKDYELPLPGVFQLIKDIMDIDPYDIGLDPYDLPEGYYKEEDDTDDQKV